MRIILASGSPRRKELLKLIIPQFDIIVSEEEEKIQKGKNITEQIENLAYKKAEHVYNKTRGDRLVIAADTVVTKNNKIYGKPKNKEDAKKFIKELLEGDKMHEVISGLAVIISKNERKYEYKTSDKVRVYLKDISDSEIEKWIKTGKALDKAGAYGIQDEFCVFIEKIEGNYHTVMGLPTHKLYDILKDNEKNE